MYRKDRSVRQRDRATEKLRGAGQESSTALYGMCYSSRADDTPGYVSTRGKYSCSRND